MNRPVVILSKPSVRDRSLATKVRTRAMTLGFGAAAACRSPRAMAALLASSLDPIEGPWSASAPLLWMLGKEGLTEDLLVSLRASPWARPTDVSRLLIKTLADRFLPPGIDDNTYVTGNPADDRAKEKCRQLWRSVLRALPARARPAAVTSGNFGYYAEREMAGACEEEGVPFIVMHKECFKAPGRVKFFTKVYERRGAFSGRRVLVYNRLERDVQVASGVAPPERITVCGMPRLDRIHAWRTQPHAARSGPPTLLAFGFTPKTGMPRIPRKSRGGAAGGFDHIDPAHEGMAWTSLFAQYHEMLVRIATDNPNVRVVLKLKSRVRDSTPSLELVRALGQPENLQVSVGGDPFDLVTAADAVCGFNTTALLEGVAAGVPVFVPMFDEAAAPLTAEFVPDLGAAATAAVDPAAMERGIVAALRARQPTPTLLAEPMLAMLDHWVGNADGQAGARVRAAFARELHL